VGSILVGLLLGGVAIFLIQRNRALLIGRSMAEEELTGVMLLLTRDPVVKNIYDAKSEEIGPGVYRCGALEWVGPRAVHGLRGDVDGTNRARGSLGTCARARVIAHIAHRSPLTRPSGSRPRSTLTATASSSAT